MNINKFKAHFDGGYRPSLFEVQIGFPAGVAGEAAQQVSLLCKGAQIPEDQIGQIPVFYMGRQIKVAGNREFTDISLTFYQDSSFNVREAMERWMALMNTHEGNLGVVNPNQYKGDLIITAMGRDGSRLKTYKVVGAFPTNISALDLSFDAIDTVAETQINFSYDYWQTEEIK